MDYIKQFRSDFVYTVTTSRASLPITLTLVKSHLNLDPDDTSQEAYLTFLIEAVTDYAEAYMRKVLINTTFKTTRDTLVPAIQLRRSPFVSLGRFQYLVNGVLTDIDSSLYYIVEERDYSYIALKADSTYPTDVDDQLYPIEIEFTAGYGTSDTDVPSDIRLALLNHLAVVYENRGDCDEESMANALSNTARMIYDKYRPLEIV
jgi:uncharacterized phiE125 gp8 family phage protein